MVATNKATNSKATDNKANNNNNHNNKEPTAKPLATKRTEAKLERSFLTHLAPIPPCLYYYPHKYFECSTS